MNTLAELSCPNCGAAIMTGLLRGPVASCDHCGTSFRVPDSLSPAPEMGDLLLGADFRNPDVPGWLISNREKVEFRPGSPAEIWVKFEPDALIHPILRTPGPLDDFDASVTIRFVEGNREHISAGLEVRSGDAGDYIVRVSAQGTYGIGWHVKTDWGGNLVGWSRHPALRDQLGQPNRLRVVMRGPQLRVYLNGVMATSIRDDKFPFGLVRLVVSPTKESSMVVAFSDLQIREAPRT